MPAVHCPSNHIGRSSVAGLHDSDRIDEYVACIQEAIGYMRQTLSRPRVLHIGFGLGGLLPSVSFLMGAAVTVVDANSAACEVMQARVLEHNLTGVRIVNVNSTRFYDEEPYDLVIMDSFGATLAEKGQFVYAYDLVRRGMVRKFEDACRFIPAEVSMGLSLYSCPGLSVLQQGGASHQNLSFWLGLDATTPEDKKLKFVPASKLLPFSLDATNCDRAADRHEVAYARYGSRKEPLVTLSHVNVVADRARHGPRLWLLEWVATLSPFEHLPRRHVGTYLGLEAVLDPTCRLARHVAWGHLCCLEPAICSTYCIKIGVRATGELTLTAQDEPAADVKQVSFLKRIDAVAEGTFAASLPSSATKKATCDVLYKDYRVAHEDAMVTMPRNARRWIDRLVHSTIDRLLVDHMVVAAYQKLSHPPADARILAALACRYLHISVPDSACRWGRSDEIRLLNAVGSLEVPPRSVRLINRYAYIRWLYTLVSGTTHNACDLALATEVINHVRKGTLLPPELTALLRT